MAVCRSDRTPHRRRRRVVAHPPGRMPFPLLGVASFALVAPVVAAVALGSGPRLLPTEAASHPVPGSQPAPVSAPGSAALPSAALPSGWTMTQYGPLSPADRDIVIRVRLAGLWEAPAGAEATQRAADPKVRQVGEHLAREHTTLDETVRSVAGQLGIALPNAPTAEQRGWLDELDRARGAQFDQTFVDRLRAAHGTVFGLLSGVRAGTRNDLVRSFAQSAVDIVMRHMTLLESTGLVHFADLPVPGQPAPSAGKLTSADPGMRVVGLAWLAVVATLALGGWYLLRGSRRRSNPQR